MYFKNFINYLFALLLPCALTAQVTTSSISGTVRTSTEVLAGATVSAVHIPTGTAYTTSTQTKGIFNIVNMIPGGPYKVTVTFVGFQPFTQDNVFLSLGENTRIDADLSGTSSSLTEVIVTGSGTGTRRKTGASTSISRQQIASLPSLSRSLQDFTRLTPQANGNSFGGASNRFNNITIDGAVNNDVFGLSNSGTPGGQAGTTPISLDAISEIQVVLAPYDVSFGNFTGGGVNAVTRSGTNNFEGSVYAFGRNENTVGKDPISRLKTTKFSDRQVGFRLGGPIIQNKLFFFVNAEMARRTAPTLFNAGETGSAITVAEAQGIADTLRRRYNYDAGEFNSVNTETESDKIFGRIDWNISSKHRLTLRHNYIKAFDDNISRSITSFRFGNNAYRFNNSQNITVAELRSQFNKTYSNNLILGLHRIRDFRTTYGQPFPAIDINKGSAIFNTGSERSSNANELDQDIFEITDNLKIFKGKHTFTLGTHNEFFKFRNLFIGEIFGRWNFATINDFNNNNPRQVSANFSNVPGDAKPSARFDAAQLGFYAQDEIQFNDRFRLTVGLRADLPVVGETPAYNKIVDSTFKGVYNTSNIPNKQLLWSPRVGFNYDVEGNRRVIVRGGVGVFTGRVPFVWISNQFTNNGLLLNSINVTDNPNTPQNEVNGGRGFDPNANLTTLGAASRNFAVNLIDKDFKIPQVLRFNVGADVKLPGGINATFDAMYSQTLNNVFYQDVNLANPVGIVDQAFNNGADKRIAYASTITGRRINPNITDAILISNTNKGYTYNFTAQLSKAWNRGFIQLAYNFNDAADVNSGASSTALSNWQFVQVVGNPNDPQLSRSNYALTHRVTGLYTYNISYAKYFKSSISFFYAGTSGSPFTYVTNGDLNSDSRFGNDLIYVPRNAGEIRFVDFLNANNTVRFTAAEQAVAFQQFIDNDDYLSKRRGMYTERNGAATPWEHVVDMRFAQDFSVLTGKKRHTLQFSFDVFNFTNLLNNDWGRQYFVSNSAYNLLSTINRTTGPFAGKGYNFGVGQEPWNINFGSRFQGQIGIRYLFQ